MTNQSRHRSNSPVEAERLPFSFHQHDTRVSFDKTGAFHSAQLDGDGDGDGDERGVLSFI